MKDKIRKLLIVSFLTMFIWAWAFNAIEEKTQQSVILTIASSAVPDKQVGFEGFDSPAIIVLDLVGPASQIDKLNKDIDNNGRKLQFAFNIIDDKKYLSSGNMLNVTAFMKDSARTELPEFNIESASPSTIKVLIEDLEIKTLDVMVVDKDDFRLDVKSIKPRSTVDVYVRKDAPDTLKAIVRLTDERVAKARSSQITESYVYIGDELKLISTELKIELPPTEQKLKQLSFKPKYVGLAMSESMQGKYEIELLYKPEQKTFWASVEAMEAYKAVAPYQVIIEIAEVDWKTTQEQGDVSRQVIYKFPEEYVRKGEIRLADDQKPGVATFKVTRIKE